MLLPRCASAGSRTYVVVQFQIMRPSRVSRSSLLHVLLSLYLYHEIIYCNTRRWAEYACMKLTFICCWSGPGPWLWPMQLPSHRRMGRNRRPCCGGVGAGRLILSCPQQKEYAALTGAAVSY